MNFQKDAYMNSLLEEIKRQQDEAISSMLNDAIAKGFIRVRQSNPVLIQSATTDKIELRHSIVLDYLGAEKIEQLEKDLEYMKAINEELHAALKEFYEKTRPNVWLKNQGT